MLRTASTPSTPSSRSNACTAAKSLLERTARMSGAPASSRFTSAMLSAEVGILQSASGLSANSSAGFATITAELAGYSARSLQTVSAVLRVEPPSESESLVEQVGSALEGDSVVKAGPSKTVLLPAMLVEHGAASSHDTTKSSPSFGAHTQDHQLL
eukprot:CAMPEP_0115425434 /NCGR_PEP_ID=MMETSP0271-20121206/28376_1 /TAXON_ID=71861 /ORGANISM="Scrippsiella trochoidea, Strain CCMP3099" /LENGTH=155 /DNA_ID=CAMNT_0002850329 /DNA_START=106 /DNA_END=569 /DNA_ORIENTATION=+